MTTIILPQARCSSYSVYIFYEMHLSIFYSDIFQEYSSYIKMKIEYSMPTFWLVEYSIMILLVMPSRTGSMRCVAVYNIYRFKFTQHDSCKK